MDTPQLSDLNLNSFTAVRKKGFVFLMQIKLTFLVGNFTFLLSEARVTGW